MRQLDGRGLRDIVLSDSRSRGRWVVDQLLETRRAPLETLELILLGRRFLSALH